jgi:DNA-binding response OmpR family regulator
MGFLKETKVLYVEDDKETREAMGKFLKRRTGKLLTATCGAEGLSLFAEHKPDLVIADLILPDITGMEMIREIRKRNSNCPILITSTVSKVETILEAVNVGIVSYIIKPVDTSELEKKLEYMTEEVAKHKNYIRQTESYERAEKKGELEDEIRKEFLKLLKDASGKGPGKLIVYLGKTELEIAAYDALTPMEKRLIQNVRNISLVEQSRELFYREIAEEMEKIAERVTGLRFKLISIEVNGGRKADKLILTRI